ncbi:transcription regulator Sfg11 [Rhodothalassium salexigens DSM 2132]|uniref:Transcription regulator Sfg11 n=1 Tax=Rhodothalassium salexigens DSM 2132 TaxID=1188247 RepID=A0A4R2PDS8_RHOSA|nr:hypothetical protein [Rhodothalassium salexigens]MBB4212023.1 hypothetical protein [Rhodothalassium salexigens DSM 2132]MBK1638491.1 hypothetical protein [Rhodothalassium salexigens DSM 2132]TCP33393.1 transcription regulator Sfg11 [Rhodothalassium salexigens DSM 2132]
MIQMVDHECPICGRTIRGSGFFRHVTGCAGVGQMDMRTVWEEPAYRGHLVQRWRATPMGAAVHLTALKPRVANWRTVTIKRAAE